jgi:hypothetical protein
LCDCQGEQDLLASVVGTQIPEGGNQVKAAEGISIDQEPESLFNIDWNDFEGMR